MFSVNYRDSRPLYEQLCDDMRRQIIAGAFGEGRRLPSVRELASQLAINPNTIQRAYRELESEGYIHSLPGKGSFAAEAAEASRISAWRLLLAFDATVKELLALGTAPAQLISRIEDGDTHGKR